MDEGYETGTLRAADIYRAFAVIQAIMPGLGLEAWEALTATAVLRHDWLTVADARGYLRGICHLFVREHLAFGRRLEIPIFASVSLLDEEGVAKRLFEAIKHRALEAGCEKMHFWKWNARDWQSLEIIKASEPWDDGQVCDLSADLNDAHPSIFPVKM
ncbi:hypothetical protein ACFFP0_26275 [Rhizobium puerariae]|uniref:GNAT family N-acetyltransferase n=1 Tax=Rhizobium puerariae TaxID=1585791 RepID=A0ABV6AP13_9HYPH